MSNSAQDRSFLTLAFCLRVCWEERRDGKGVNGYQKYSYYMIFPSKIGLKYVEYYSMFLNFRKYIICLLRLIKQFSSKISS